MKRHRLWHRLSGVSSGFLDSGFSSIATFAVGFYSVRVLSNDGLALYSILMASYVMCMIIPQQLYFFPTRIMLNLNPGQAAPSLGRDLVQASPALSISAMIVFVCGLPLLQRVDPIEYCVMAGSAGLLTIAGAVQGHMRGCLHILGKHFGAAAMSITTAIVCVLSVALVTSFDLSSTIASSLSFGLLAVAYCVSMFWWIICTKDVSRAQNRTVRKLRTRVLYMIPDISTQVVVYVTGLIVVAVLGASALADIEAARLAASPVFVLAAGLASSLVPEALRSLSGRRVYSISRRLVSLKAFIFIPSVVYAILIAFSGQFLSLAFHRDINSSLSASRALAFGMEGASNTLSSFYVAINRTVPGIWIALAASLLSLVVLVPALLCMGLYAHPFAQGCGALVRSIWGDRYIAKHASASSLTPTLVSQSK